MAVVLVDKAAIGDQGKFIKIFMAVHWGGNGGVEIGTVSAGDASLMMKIICSYFFVKAFHKAPPRTDIIDSVKMFCQ